MNHQIYVQLQEIKITEFKTKYEMAVNVVFLGNKTQNLLYPTDMQGFQKTVEKIMENKLTKDY